MKKHRIISFLLAGALLFGSIAPIHVSAADAGTPTSMELSVGTESTAADAEIPQETAGSEGMQEAILELPSLEEYDYLSLDGKEAVDHSVDSMLDTYYSKLSGEEKRAVDAPSLFALDLYADSYAYYETEEEYDGQLTLEDVETKAVSEAQLVSLQEGIDALPDLSEVTDVSDVAVDAGTGRSAGKAIAAADTDAGTYYTDEEMDDLFLEVSDLAEVYYSLDETQAQQVAEENLTSLVAYLSTGVSMYSARSVGEIKSYGTYRYSGSLTSKNPRFGYYTVATNATGGATSVAFCSDSNASTPGGAGTSIVSEYELNNNEVKVILYYGYGGPGECVSHDMNGYAETHYAIDWALDRNASNKNLASAAYAKLYTNQADKSVADSITAYAGSSGVSGTQSLIYFKYQPKPKYGHLNLAKRGATTKEVLLGAAYEVYSDPSCSVYANDINGNHTLRVTSANAPYSNTLTYAPGTYYVRESRTLPAGTRWDSTVYTVRIVADQSVWVSPYGWNEDIEYGSARIRKTDSTDPDKTVPGAVYRIYTDPSCTVRAKSDLGADIELVTDRTNSNTVTVAPGTYYIKEFQAAEGYRLSDTVYPLTVRRGETGLVNVTDPPNTGYVKIQKVSMEPEITEANDAYSLAGATYGVYATRSDAKQDANRITTLTTDANGETESYELKSGASGITYYVKELTPSEGFLLCDGTDGSDQGIHAVTVRTDQIAEVSCKEPLATADFPLQLQKYDADTGLPKPQGTASLKGAVFAVEYWNNNDGNTSGEPDSVWYYRTDENGRFEVNREDQLIYSYTFGKEQSQSAYAGKTVTSSPLHRDSEGNIYFYMGTYRVREISPPKLYQLKGTICMSGETKGEAASVTDGCVLVIAYDREQHEAVYEHEGSVIQAENLSMDAHDFVHLNMITITKYGKGKRPLAGVTYRLVRSADGKEVAVRTTDEDGIATFSDLIPGEYILTEIRTADGYNLLEENITVSVPCQMTEEEVRDSHADMEEAYFDEESQTFCFETVNYDITDSAHFDLPLTGGSQGTLYLLLAVSVVMTAAGWYLFSRKKVE